MTTDLLPDGETLLVYPSTPYTLPLDFGEDITGRTFTASYGEAAATVEANGTDGLFVSFTSAARGRSALLIVETTVTPRAFLRFPIDVSAATGSGSSAPFTVNAPDDLTITVTPVAGLVVEAAQDLVGSMFTGNTETGISATYNDGTGKIDLVAEVTQAEVDGLATSIASAIASGDATTLASASAYTDSEVAALEDVYLAKTGLVVDARDHLALDGTTDDTTALTNIVAALSVTGGSIIFPPNVTVKLTQLPIIDPSRVALRGAGSSLTTFDFSAAPAGPVIRLQMPSVNASKRIVPISGVQILGPQSRQTTVDGIELGGTSVYANAMRFVDVVIDGFRDQVTYQSNAYLNIFDGCLFNHPRRRSINYSGSGSNFGENEVFDHCVFANGELALYCSPSSAGANFTFIATSFDYLDQALDLAGLTATVNLLSCHYEANHRTVTDLATTSGSPTVTSASASWIASDVGKKIAGTGIPANTYIGVVNSTTSIGLSSSPTANTPVNATATATITGKIAARYYIHHSVQGSISDQVVNIRGGQLVPTWDAESREAFYGITGTTNTGQARLFISALGVQTSVGATCRYLVFDGSTNGGNGIQQRGSNTVEISGTTYTGTTSTSYTATWPLWYRDRAAKVHVLTGDTIAGRVAEQYSHPFRVPQLWETLPRSVASDLHPLTSGTLYLARLSMPDGGWVQATTATQRWLAGLGTLGSGVTEFRIGLFWGMQGPNSPQDNTNLRGVYNSGHQASPTANALNTYFTTSVGAVAPEHEVYLGVLCIGTTPHSLWGLNSGVTGNPLWSASPALGFKLTGQASMPSTILRSSLVATDFIPYLAVQPTLS